MYLKKTCPGCSGTGWTLNLWDARNWIPFQVPKHLWTRCSRCYGRGYVCSSWHNRRRV